MIRSLRTGVSGLKSHQTRMDVVGNNIANVNTIAFKRGRAAFGEVLGQEMLGVGRTAGGTGINPSYIGLGVAPGSIDQNWEQGSLESTGIQTDLALNGDGFFIAEAGGRQMLTRAGNFTFNRDGQFVTNNGLNVQGWRFADDGTLLTGSLQDIKIDPNAQAPAKQTENVFVGGNVSADATVGDTTSVSTVVYDDQGKAHTVVVDMARTQKMGEDGATTDTWKYAIRDTDGNIIDGPEDGTGSTTAIGAPTNLPTTDASNYGGANDVTYTFTVLEDGTVGDDSITLAYDDGQGTSGRITLPDDDPSITTREGLELDFTGSTEVLRAGQAFKVPVDSSGTAGDATSLGFDEDNGNAPTPTVMGYDGIVERNYTFRVVDAGSGDIGVDEPVQLEWTDEDGNTGTIEIPDDYDPSTSDPIEGPQGLLLRFDLSGTTVAEGDTFTVNAQPGDGNDLTFGTDGQLTNATNSDGDVASSFEWDIDGDGNLDDLTLNFGTPGEDGLTQFSGSTTATVREQDGRASGSLAGYSINPEGVLELNFTNGEQQKLFQLAVGTVNNPGGLEQRGENFYTTSSASGDLQLGRAGRDVSTAVVAGTLEMSNVDLATEFTDMIVAQRGYQASARVITTSDEMMQETVQLKR